MEGFEYRCWVATSAVLVNGDLETVEKVSTDPPINTGISPASGMHATRNKNNVTITWNPAPNAVDLHYLIRAKVCNGQYMIEVIDVTSKTAYTLQDQQGCSGNSSAKIHVVNRTGYSASVNVTWP
jgi:hypothetical protein